MATAPSVPLIKIRPVAASGKLTFYWAAPSSDGGSAITSYTLTCSGRSDEVIADPATRVYTVTGLTNGTSYTFSLYATNAVGNGPAAVYRTVQPGSKPSGVQDISANTLGEDGAIISWSAPASDGGADLGWYVVQSVSSSGGDPVLKKSRRFYQTSCKLSGLNTASSYTFNVRPVNDPGYGPSVISNQISFGGTWTQRSSPAGYLSGLASVACSSDFSIVYISGSVSLNSDHLVFKSTDGGVTWTSLATPTPFSPTGNINNIVCSSDGSIVYICVKGSFPASRIYKSTDGGSSWSELTAVTGTGSGYIFAVACSADGSKLVYGRFGDYVYVSTDGGANVTAATSIGTDMWSRPTISGDGSTIYICGFGGDTVYRSLNSGSSWSTVSGGTGKMIDYISCSSDGTKMVARSYSLTEYYISTNSGGSLTTYTTPDSYVWNIVANSDFSILYGFPQTFGAGSTDYYKSTNNGSSFTAYPYTFAVDAAEAAINSSGTKIILTLIDSTDYVTYV